jgi:hypothetical protein
MKQILGRRTNMEQGNDGYTKNSISFRGEREFAGGMFCAVLHRILKNARKQIKFGA